MKYLGRLLSVILLVVAGCTDATNSDPAPAAPDNVTLTLRTGELRVTWRERDLNAQIYRVDVSIDNGPWLYHSEVARGTSTVALLDPAPEMHYAFRVSACNRGGCSEPAEARITTHAIEQPVVRITRIQPISPTSVNVLLEVLVQDREMLDLHVALRPVGGDPSSLIVRQERLTGFRHYFETMRYPNLAPSTQYVVTATVRKGFANATDVFVFSTAGLATASYTDLRIVEVTPSSMRASARIHPGSGFAYYFMEVRHAGTLVERKYGSLAPDSTARTAADRPPTEVAFSGLQPGTDYTLDFILSNEPTYLIPPVATLSFRTPSN